MGVIAPQRPQLLCKASELMPSGPEREPATPRGTVPPSGLKNGRLGDTYRCNYPSLTKPHSHPGLRQRARMALLQRSHGLIYFFPFKTDFDALLKLIPLG